MTGAEYRPILEKSKRPPGRFFHALADSARSPELTQRLSEVTPTELVGLLARAYAADHAEPGDAPSATECTALSDALGCHEDVRAASAVWCQQLGGVTEDEAACWLEVEFVESRPVEQANSQHPNTF